MIWSFVLGFLGGALAGSMAVIGMLVWDDSQRSYPK